MSGNPIWCWPSLPIRNNFLIISVKDRPLDVAILVDRSTYYTNEQWQYILSYLRSYVDQIRISPDPKGNHVSLICYSSSAAVMFNFNAPQNVDDVKRRIDGLIRQAGYRRPDEALKLASSDLFTPSGGARDGARKVCYFKPTNSSLLLSDTSK